MSVAHYINVTIHVLAAMLWLGGMFFFGIVGAPALRAVEPRELRQRLFGELGTRFRTVGWFAIVALVATGIGNLHFRGLLHWEAGLGSLAFWQTSYGTVLAIKLGAVTTMIVLSAIHDFVIGPRAVRAGAGGDSAQSDAWRRRAALVARINAMVGVILLVAAVRLAR